MANADSYLPAQMKKRVLIQNVVQSTDGQGGFTEAFTDFITVWAYIRPTKAYEKMQMGQIMAPITHKITIRYQTGISAKQRMKYTDSTGAVRIFNIKEVINVEEQGKFLEIQAIEQQ